MKKLTESEIVEDFKTDLKNCIFSAREKIEEHQANIDTLQKKLDSKRYSNKVNQELENKIRAEKMSIRDSCVNCVGTFQSNAEKIISKYAEIARNLDTASGGEITDDAKLLNSGLRLYERDIQAISERCKGNHTMERMFIEYCRSNGFEIPEATLLDYGSGNRLAKKIEDCWSGIYYYANWIDKPQYADDMLHKMLPYLFEEE